MNLSVKLSIAVFVIIFVLICLTGTVAYFLTRSFTQDVITTNNTEAAINTMDKIDRFINERIVDIEFISELSIVTESLKSEVDQEETKEKLEELIHKNSVWWDISIIDPEGNYISSTSEDNIDTSFLEGSVENKILFDKAMEGETAYSDIIVLNNADNHTISLTTPVWSRGDNPQIIGIINANLALPTITDILSSLKTAQARLVNSQGVLIASNVNIEKNQSLKRNFSNSQVFKAAKQNKIGTITAQDLDDKEDEALQSYTIQQGYESFKGHNWILFLETPLSVAYAPARNAALTQVALSTIITITAGACVVVILSRVIINPIVTLSQSTKSIARGNFDQKVPAKSHDELGELAESFNQMSDKIQEAYAGLEDQVRSKTSELSEKVIELEKLNKVMINRELKMIELKEKNEELLKKLNSPSNQ